MDDLISRQAAIDFIESEWREWGEEYGITDVLCDLDDMPAAEPRKGRWIKQSDPNSKLFGWYTCSECGAFIGEEPPYCSNCGARMEESE